MSDTDIALFSQFIPVGVWAIQGLLDQQSTVKPDTIHADTTHTPCRQDRR